MYTTYLLSPLKTIKASRENIPDFNAAVRQADSWFKHNTDCTATVWEHGFSPVYTVEPIRNA